MHLRQTIVAAAVATVLLCVVATLTIGQNARSESSSLPAFKGKVISLHLKSDPQKVVVLEKSEVKKIGTSDFLVGTVVNSGDKDWTAGNLIWISVDDVSMVVDFKDVESLRKQVEKGQ